MSFLLHNLGCPDCFLILLGLPLSLGLYHGPFLTSLRFLLCIENRHSYHSSLSLSSFMLPPIEPRSSSKAIHIRSLENGSDYPPTLNVVVAVLPAGDPSSSRSEGVVRAIQPPHDRRLYAAGEHGRRELGSCDGASNSDDDEDGGDEHYGF